MLSSISRRQLREIALERDNTRRRVNELSKQVGQLRPILKCKECLARPRADQVQSRANADTEFPGVQRACLGNDHGRNEGTNINPNIDEVTKVP